MRKLIKLKKDISIVFNTQITEYLNPDEIYLPIKKNYKTLVKKGDAVLKGQIVIENNLNKVISPISGNAVSISKKNLDGVMTDCLVIQNDFKEKNKNYIRKKETKYDKEIIVSKLYEYYFKYIASILESKKINNLVISGLEDEPYIANNPYIINAFSKEILEMADILSSTFHIENTLIAIKNNDTRNVEMYLSKIGTYPNITLTLVDDKYLLGKEYFLLEHLHLKELDSLVIDASTFLDMYNAIKYNKCALETFITISGPSVSRSGVVKVKVGTLIKDVVDNVSKLKGKENIYILNGVMMGHECDINESVVTRNTLGVVVIPKKVVKEENCINCGLCLKVCPVKVNPRKVMSSHKISNNCLDCGLCSYICPSHINLRRFLRGEYE
ncbi:MAG: 4Fe-4S dicluster domain-containing protein [Firmicutes bacterium]|nr:4Fe-4S dicluster domain-containing protein [Bacillota bacterium]